MEGGWDWELHNAPAPVRYVDLIPQQWSARLMARVVVDVMLKPEILDPAGQAVTRALLGLGVEGVAGVRIGKRVEIEFDGEPDLDAAQDIADRLLANPVIEDFSVRAE